MLFTPLIGYAFYKLILEPKYDNTDLEDLEFKNILYFFIWIVTPGDYKTFTFPFLDEKFSKASTIMYFSFSMLFLGYIFFCCLKVINQCDSYMYSFIKGGTSSILGIFSLLLVKGALNAFFAFKYIFQSQKLYTKFFKSTVKEYGKEIYYNALPANFSKESDNKEFEFRLESKFQYNEFLIHGNDLLIRGDFKIMTKKYFLYNVPCYYSELYITNIIPVISLVTITILINESLFDFPYLFRPLIIAVVPMAVLFLAFPFQKLLEFFGVFVKEYPIKEFIVKGYPLKESFIKGYPTQKCKDDLSNILAKGIGEIELKRIDPKFNKIENEVQDNYQWILFYSEKI